MDLHDRPAVIEHDAMDRLEHAVLFVRDVGGAIRGRVTVGPGHEQRPSVRRQEGARGEILGGEIGHRMGCFDHGSVRGTRGDDEQTPTARPLCVRCSALGEEDEIAVRRILVR